MGWTPRRILVVDDDQLQRDSLKALLETADFAVSTAGSVDEALKLIAQDSGMHAVVSDLYLGGAGDDATGFDVAQYCSTHRPDLAVVILTGFFGVKAVRDRARQVADAVLPKPVRGVELAGAILSSIRQRSKRRAELLSVSSTAA